MKTVKVTIERGIKGDYSAYISSNNCEFGCIGEGKTAKETEEDFMAGVEDLKRVYASEGKTFPDVKFVFQYDVASFLNYYSYAFSLAGLERITGINQRQLSHYVTGVRRPSKHTTKRIENSMKEFASEIAELNLV